jgi:steroid 5-alpha reductase family enzyme
VLVPHVPLVLHMKHLVKVVALRAAVVTHVCAALAVIISNKNYVFHKMVVWSLVFSIISVVVVVLFKNIERQR